MENLMDCLVHGVASNLSANQKVNWWGKCGIHTNIHDGVLFTHEKILPVAWTLWVYDTENKSMKTNFLCVDSRKDELYKQIAERWSPRVGEREQWEDVSQKIV